MSTSILKIASAVAVAFGIAQSSSAFAAEIEGDQVYDGNATIPADTTVKGNVVIMNGTLRVFGTIEGDIIQTGSGNVTVDGEDALVKGNIDERGGGSVIARNGATVEGNIDERGGGDVNVTTTDGSDKESLVKGDISERGSGSVQVLQNALVEGNVEERNAGDVKVKSGGTVKGNVTERGPGEVDDDGGIIEGNIE